MFETYKAKVEGDHIEWQDGVPEAVASGEAVEVMVTLLDRTAPGEPRPIGLAEGDFVVPDDFDSPLPDEVVADFEN